MKNTRPSIKQHGFTLIELIMVIVLLGILSAGAVSFFATPSSYSTFLAKDQLISQARLAQQIALGDGSNANPATLVISNSGGNWNFNVTKASNSSLNAASVASSGNLLSVTSGGSTNAINTDGASVTLTWDDRGNLTNGASMVSFTGGNNFVVCISAQGFAYENGGACP